MVSLILAFLKIYAFPYNMDNYWYTHRDKGNTYKLSKILNQEDVCNWYMLEKGKTMLFYGMSLSILKDKLHLANTKQILCLVVVVKVEVLEFLLEVEVTEVYYYFIFIYFFSMVLFIVCFCFLINFLSLRLICRRTNNLGGRILMKLRELRDMIEIYSIIFSIKII